MTNSIISGGFSKIIVAALPNLTVGAANLGKNLIQVDQETDAASLVENDTDFTAKLDLKVRYSIIIDLKIRASLANLSKYDAYVRQMGVFALIGLCTLTSTSLGGEALRFEGVIIKRCEPATKGNSSAKITLEGYRLVNTGATAFAVGSSSLNGLTGSLI